MSDYMEFTEYYKKAWERAVTLAGKEYTKRGWNKAIKELRNHGWDEAADFLEQRVPEIRSDTDEL
jgi:hypothetical protein